MPGWLQSAAVNLGTAQFADRYGPWALVAGASDGVGLAYARAMAERGVHVMLLSGRQTVLDGVATGIRDRWGVQTRTLAVDLSEDAAVPKIIDAAADLEVGTLMYCAGADPNFTDFLDAPVEAAAAMVRRNCLVPIQLCHHFARPMRIAEGGAWSSSPPVPAWSAPAGWSPTAPPRPSTW